MSKEKRLLKFNFILLFFIILGVFSFASSAFAATMSFVPSTGSYKTGDTIKVKVIVSSSTSINAISGQVSFPNNNLSLTSISKAGSIINLWAQEPSYSNTSGQAIFEGVVLNGYTGNTGTVITFIFKAKLPGTANIKFDQASVLANDGNGSEVLTGKGVATITIMKAIAEDNKAVIDTSKDIPTTEVKDTNIKIEEISQKDTESGVKKFLITPPSQVKNMEYMVSIDSLDVVSWIDDGTHIYEVSNLSKGTHYLKITALGLAGEKFNGSIEFSTEFINTPVITDFPTDFFADNFLVLKGIADSMTDINILITNTKDGEVMNGYTSTNNSGKFSFVSENKMKTGFYQVVAKAVTKDGIESNFSNPITIEVKDNFFNKFMLQVNSYLAVITPVLALIVLLIFVLLYGIYHIRKFHKYLKKKLSNTYFVYIFSHVLTRN